MKQTLWLIVGTLGMSVFAQNSWTQAEITSLFDQAYHEGVAEAVAELESQQITAYDFGMDLVALGHLEQARAWYDLMILAGGDTQPHLFGKAWVQKEQSDLQSAMVTANHLLTAATDDLTRARAHYLLGSILKAVGSTDLANQKFDTALTLYTELNKPGGINNCQNAMAEGAAKTTTVFRKTGPDSNPPPPRDDSDS